MIPYVLTFFTGVIVTVVANTLTERFHQRERERAQREQHILGCVRSISNRVEQSYVRVEDLRDELGNIYIRIKDLEAKQPKES